MSRRGSKRMKAGGPKPRRQRQRMRPWLESILNAGTCPSLSWKDKKSKSFTIMWKHASGRTWKQDLDTEIFRLYAIHTGKYIEGGERDPKRWKANFRCALNSLPDVEELQAESYKKGENAYKVYRFIDEPPTAKKRSSKRTGRRNDSDSEDEDVKPATEIEVKSEMDVCDQTETRCSSEIKKEMDTDEYGDQPLNNTLPLDDTDTEHNYSKNGIPDLPTFRDPVLCSGGSVQLSESKLIQPSLNVDFKLLIARLQGKSDDIDTGSCDGSSSGEAMTDEEVVEMVDSMRDYTGDSGFSETESSSGNSPISTLWNEPLIDNETSTHQLIPSESVPAVVTEITCQPETTNFLTLTALEPSRLTFVD